jgi:DNA-directed RNA polymerase subunit M/transcription elongation factor TFIIS
MTVYKSRIKVGDAIKIEQKYMKKKYVETLDIKGQVKCSNCGCENLKVFMVEGNAMEDTQAYHCVKCGHIQMFGVSE